MKTMVRMSVCGRAQTLSVAAASFQKPRPDEILTGWPSLRWTFSGGDSVNATTGPKHCSATNTAYVFTPTPPAPFVLTFSAKLIDPPMTDPSWFKISQIEILRPRRSGSG